MTTHQNIRIQDYTYTLPPERIAAFPLARRDESKLLIYNGQHVSHTRFANLPELLPEKSFLVFNNTKVIQARLNFRKKTGAHIEIFCLTPFQPADFAENFAQPQACQWKCIVGNLKKWKTGRLEKKIQINGTEICLSAKKVSSLGEAQIIEFQWNNPKFSFAEVVDSAGVTPLPPYIKRKAEESDKNRYQTVYSKIKGSVAAPTAGLHFTERVFHGLRQKNIQTAELTLHVGAGTFKPVKSETIGGHTMHTENFFVEKKFLQRILPQAGSLLAVGTTTVRTLESLYWIGVKIIGGEGFPEGEIRIEQWETYDLPRQIAPQEALEAVLNYLERENRDFLAASTQIIIVPGYEFRTISGLITNFHQPQSTLLLLVAALTGENWKKIYGYALNNDFRFLSYGDSSLLWK